MQDIAIELQLANRKYPLKIRESESDVMQRAAGLVNGKIKDFREKYGVNDIQDLLAMTALQLATQLLETDHSGTAANRQLEASIDSLDALLDELVSGN